MYVTHITTLRLIIFGEQSHSNIIINNKKLVEQKRASALLIAAQKKKLFVWSECQSGPENRETDGDSYYQIIS